MRNRTLARLAAVAAVSAALAAVPATADAAPPRVTIPSLPGTALPLPADVGAAVPFTEYEAEHARTTGAVLGPDRAYTHLAAEASGRRAVALDPGEYVEFVLARTADAVDVRYSIQDGRETTLRTRIDGRAGPGLALTSAYAHAYGLFPFTNDPADGGAHHFFDDARVMFPRTLPAGTRVRFEAVAPTVLDLADFETVGPAPSQPAGYLDATDFGADPSGGTESLQAIQAAIDAARDSATGLWIPPGRYRVGGKLRVDEVTVRGAGPWRTVLTGPGVGVFGTDAPDPSTNVHLSDFAVFGETTVRDDTIADSGFGGSFGGASTIDNVWIEHTKVGMWFDGPSEGLTVSRARIKNVWADGINLHNGVSRTTIRDTFVRNTGDDGMAMWSDRNADHHNAFTRNTVVLPLLANAFAVYGGHDNIVTGNIAADSVTQGGGIHVANRFGSVPLAGTTTLSWNLLVRAGSLVPNDPVQIGAIWFWAADAPMTGAIRVEGERLIDSSYAGVQFYGGDITGVTVDRVAILGAGSFAVQVQATGAASFSRVVAGGLGEAGVHTCGDGFALTRGKGNIGWGTSTCGLPAAGQLELAPAAGLDFGFHSLGESATLPLTVTNPGPDPVEVTAIRPPAGFTVLGGTCPTIAVGANCTVLIGFAPVTAGFFQGRMVLETTSPAGPYVVGLTGIGFDPDGNLALGRTATASSTAGWWLPPSNVVDGDQGTYFESANGAFPQTLGVDLGRDFTVGRIVLKLPDGWGTRTQTIALTVDGTPLLAATDHSFDPATGNAVTITFSAVSARELVLTFTGNTGWPAAQISEFEVYAH
ncbi:choice-of-anchor D domain-containing protein [Phytomonospora endophytica]|uniref:ASPM-SPD-2-Hydin domain-containing protein n=1 Tax=Phytomonospora endophytica TaxID=714109 RepID=A0A841FFE1_9ACTN|nr:choice-of-anchor D domain-containing protein [Phytomonospora endophytica]MBB6034305.1 hypothetical protein [Phytomonospora endophytica]GIG66699.1 hypothetical protein Pen01_29940 [Phytomonospora endophytica]